MVSIKGSETEKNLLKAFAGESQARSRYDFFASVAKKEGYEQIAGFFQESALNEKEHAKIFFKYLSPRDDSGEPEGGAVEITASYPAGKIGSTGENLLASAEGESEEWNEIYPEFARIAREEGFEDVAVSFEEIGKVEAEHEKRYRKLLANVEDDKVFEKDEVVHRSVDPKSLNEGVKWKCRNCGYVYEGGEAPGACPACKHTMAYFELWVENY